MINPRLQYTRLFKLLVLIGIAFTLYVFFASLSVNDKSENAAWKSYYVGDMQAGELRKFPFAWIYKRTVEDKNLINRYVKLLQDPYSKTDRQPESAKNIWRSEKEDYFIFIPWTSQGRILRFSKVVPEEFKNRPEYVALKALPYLWDAASRRSWDMSGRLYQGNGDEFNLQVPQVKWQTKDQLLVYRKR